jgi:HAD superfamily hydrolase (TIGR01509 family)
MSPLALLLDFDGVIADTENIHIVAWERTFSSMGWVVPDDTCVRAAEIDDRVFLTEVFAGRGIAGGDIDGWVARKQKLTEAMLANSPRVYPGVASLVRRLANRIRLGVVSGTWRENIAIVLGAAGLADAFQVVIGKEDVRETKPSPEGYRLALRKLKVKAKEAVAVEDSATGLSAARAAGVRCVAIGHRAERGEWVGDAAYLSDFSDEVAVLRALGLAEMPT